MSLYTNTHTHSMILLYIIHNAMLCETLADKSFASTALIWFNFRHLYFYIKTEQQKNAILIMVSPILDGYIII